MRINFWKKESTSSDFYEETSSEGVVSDKSDEAIERSDAFEDTKYLQITRWLIYVAAFFVPLFFLPWTTSVLELNKQLLMVVLSGAGITTWLLGVVITGKIGYRNNGVNKALLAMLIAVVAATVFSMAQFRSLYGLGFFSGEALYSVAAFIIFFFLAVNTINDRGEVLRKVLGASLVLALTIGLLQMLSIYVLGLDFTHSRAFNTVGTINALGMLAALALPLFAKIKLAPARFPLADAAKIGIGVAIVILAILNWWVLWTVAIVGMLVLIALDSIGLQIAGGQEYRFKITRFLFPMTIIVLAAFLMVVQFDLSTVRSNFPVEIAPGYGPSIDIAASVLKENVVFGNGPGNFSFAFDRFGAAGLANSTLFGAKFYNGPAEVYDWVIGNGVLGMVAFLFLLWTIGAGVRSAFRQNSDGERVVGNSEFSSVAALLSASLVAFFLYRFDFTLWFIFYAALALFVLSVWGYRWRSMNIEERPILSLAGSVGFIVGLILVLSGVFFMTSRYVSDAVYAQALEQEDTDEVINTIVRAANWYRHNDVYYRSSSQVALRMVRDEISKSVAERDAAKIRNLMDSSLRFAQLAIDESPFEALNYFNMGLVHEALYSFEEQAVGLAEAAYNEAAKKRPGDPTFYARTGSMYLSVSDILLSAARVGGANGAQFLRDRVVALEKSEQYFKQALDNAPRYGAAIYNLGAVYDRQGKLNESIGQLEQVIPQNADQPGLLFELGLLYYRVGRKDNAFAALQQAAALAPNYANARWYLALILEERGNFDEALVQVRLIQENNKENQVIVEKIAQLEEGRSAIPPEDVLDQPPLEFPVE